MFKKLQNKKGFTLVELLVVIVIIAILWAVGASAFNTYINDAKLSTYDQELSWLKNSSAAKFAQSFDSDKISFNLESTTATALVDKTSTDPLTDITVDATSISAVSQTININWKDVQVLQSAAAANDAGNITIVEWTPSGGINSDAVLITYVDNDNNNELRWTIFLPIKNTSLCLSTSFDEKMVTGTEYYSNADGSNCYIYNTEPIILMR